MASASTTNSSPHYLIQLPPDSHSVTDADEEIFLLYTRLAASKRSSAEYNDGSGLGSINSKSDRLAVEFYISAATPSKHDDVRSGRKKAKTKRVSMDNGRLVSVELMQDVTSLRSRKGDTGSVLWRASVKLAKFLMAQHEGFPSSGTPLFSPSVLSRSHVYELGAGTGLLAIILSGLVQRYTVTDIPDLLPLIRKNLELNSQQCGANISAQELDWNKLSESPVISRGRYFPNPEVPIDLLLCVDCIYNPSLIKPLVTTIDHLAVRNHTAVLIVAELRDEDVLREFLETWLSSGDWELFRVGTWLEPDPLEDDSQREGDRAIKGYWADPRFVAWVGWKKLKTGELTVTHGQSYHSTETSD